MWRQFTQWLGGMGIIVLALAVLPRLRVGGRQLLEHEMPGPETEPLTASIRKTAQRLWLLYVGLTALLVAILAAFAWTGVDGTMSLYDAVAHAFTTMPTGGFGTRATSVEPYAAASQWVLVLFMLIAGANFALLYRAFARRSPGTLARDEEFRVYLAIVAVASLVLVVELIAEGIFAGEAAVRHAVFQTVSMMTTTGFGSADFTHWTALSAMALVALMFVGGSAGSTSGSVKVVRHLLTGKMLRRELDSTVHPELIQTVRLNGAPVEERTLRALTTFVLLYLACFVLGAAGLAIESAPGERRRLALRGDRRRRERARQRRPGARLRRPLRLVRAVQRPLEADPNQPHVARAPGDHPDRRALHQELLAHVEQRDPLVPSAPPTRGSPRSSPRKGRNRAYAQTPRERLETDAHSDPE